MCNCTSFCCPHCRIKMCRRVAHRASSTAATVTGGVADTSLRVADGIVSRMGGSNYGQSVLLCYSVCCRHQSESYLHATLCHTMSTKIKQLSHCDHSFPADFCSMCTVIYAAAHLHLSYVERLHLSSPVHGITLIEFVPKGVMLSFLFFLSSICC